MIEQFQTYLLLAEKSMFVLGGVIYLIFAAVIVKQTTTMSKNVNDKFNSILITFSFLHLGFAVLLVILTLSIL